MTDTRTPAQIKADNDANNASINRNPDGSPYSADRGTADQFTGKRENVVEIPDRGVTGDTTTSVPARDGDTAVFGTDGSKVVTHTDGSVTEYDARGNVINSDNLTKAEAKAVDSDATKAVKADAKWEKANPVNPQFPGEGNPNFKG